MTNYRHNFWADEGDVLLHRSDRTLWHVMDRYENVDEQNPEWAGMYRLADRTHTAQQYMGCEDIEAEFIKIGENVTGKPQQSDELRAWFE